MRAIWRPQGSSYWFPCRSTQVSKKRAVNTHALRDTQGQMLDIFTLSLYRSCIMLRCNGELYSYFYYSCTLLSAQFPLTLNNAAGHCAATSRSSPYQQISAHSAISKSNYAQFSIYGANAINPISPFTQEQHQMFVFSCCSPKRNAYWGEFLSTTPAFFDVYNCYS